MPPINSANYEEYKPHLVVSNVFINQDHFPQPQIAAIPHMVPANVVYYPNHIGPMSPPYPQAVFIPATAEVSTIRLICFALFRLILKHRIINIPAHIE